MEFETISEAQAKYEIKIRISLLLKKAGIPWSDRLENDIYNRLPKNDVIRDNQISKAITQQLEEES